METITLSMTIIFAVLVLWQVLRGSLRGLYRQIVYVVTSLVSAVVAFFVTNGLADTLLDSISAETIGDFFNKTGMTDFARFAPYFTSIEWFLVLPIATFAAPAMFAGLFFSINAAMGIVRGIINAIFGIEKTTGEPVKNFIGGVMGAVIGLVIAFIAFLPVTATVNIVGGGVDAIIASDSEGDFENMKSFDEEFAVLEDHFAVKIVNSVGGKKMLDGFATVKIDGEDVNLTGETQTLVKIVMQFVSLGSTDYSAVDPQAQVAFRSAVDSMGDSVYLSTMVSGMLSDMGRAAQDEVIPFKANPPFDEVLYSLFSIFATSNKDNVEADLHTILDVYFLLSDGGSLKAYGAEGGEDDMKNSLIAKDESGVTLITKVVEILNANEHTKPLVTTLTKMTMTMMASQLGGEYDVAEAYDKVKEGFAGVAAIDRESYGTDEEYEAARDNELKSTFTENGIELDDDTVNEIGDYIDANYGDKEEITDEEMNDILLYYYDIYAKDLESIPQE